MTQPAKTLSGTLSTFFRKRMNVFYVLAFLPLLLVAYSYMGWPFSVFVPVYGFILLLIKKPALSVVHEAKSLQRILGLIAVVSSFFVYYALVPFFPSPAFYGGANYALCLFGLFLIFFESRALREAFPSIFLIVAGISSSLISLWLEQYFARYIPYLVSLTIAILGVLGVEATTADPNIIILQTVKGPLGLGFVWGCVGASSVLIFSTILIVAFFEESCSLRTKVVWAVVGILGTLVVNMIRIMSIFLAAYFYGFDAGAKVHYSIGYILFIPWLLVFFYLFAKRQILLEGILSLWQKAASGKS